LFAPLPTLPLPLLSVLSPAPLLLLAPLASGSPLVETALESGLKLHRR